MFLSRVQIDLNNRKKIKDLTHLGAYHNWVEQSFPEEINDNLRLRHLWRLDQVNGINYLIIVSENKPDLQKLERYGVVGTGQTKDYSKFLENLNKGQRLKFRLTANPTHNVYEEGTKKKIVYPHVTIEQQKNWLIEQAKNNGFEIDNNGIWEFDIKNRDYAILVRNKKQRIKLSRVTYEGMLTITNTELFQNCLIKGIGREKAFGMGLLTVIPIN